jgi:hypothetical protein
VAFAQEGPKPDRWRGLVIDEATPEDAIKALGQPSSRKTDQVRGFFVDNKWISRKRDEKVFDVLQFKNAEGVKIAALTFLDGKLAIIYVGLKTEPEAAALSGIYGVNFMPRISGVDLAIAPQDYERREGRVYPKTYPSVYYLVSVTEKVFVGGLVSNASMGAALRGSMGIPDAGAMPGKVVAVQMISRRLENKDGADALK